MDLKIKDVADLLNVSETTIRRWISDGKIPTYRINQHNFFSRTEIENWMISHKLDKTTEGASPFTKRANQESHPTIPSKNSTTGGRKQFSLFRAIHKGEVLHCIKGNTKEEVIRATMRKVAKKLLFDADVMAELLLDREKMSTALNNGIGVPHTRDFHLNPHQDTVVVVFLEEPLEYGAMDGLPVHTLFFLFASDDKRHLHLLAKIAHLSNQSHMQNFFQTRPTKEKLLSVVKDWESDV